MQKTLTNRLALAVVVAGCGLGVAACGGSNTGAPTGGSGSSIFTTIDETHSITAGAPMNPYNASGNSFPTYDQMQLGYSENSSLNPNESYPGIASSWTLQPNGELVVRLQPSAGWSNGKPVTAADVKTSTAVAFAEDTQPANLQGVKVLGDKEIAFIPKPGAANKLFTSEVLDTIVVPASEYDSQMPADIWSVIKNSQGSGASAAAAQKTLTTLGKRIDDFAPKTDISAGPFYIVRVNPGEALLARNPHFFAANEIDPKQVVVRAYSGNEEIWNYLEGGELTAAPFTSMPTSVLHKVLSVPGNIKLVNPSQVGAALSFNEKDYPYGISAARQAIAYALNRQQITTVGEPVDGTASKLQTGMTDSVAHLWLNSSEISKLNPYAYDPAKAAALLKGAGFTKRGGQWYTPKGKPWTMTIEVASGFSDWISAATYMSNELTSFGIKATVGVAPSYATYLADIGAGDYAVGFWLNALGPAISNAFSRVWGDVTAEGSTPSGTTSNFMNPPKTYNVAGYGTLDPTQLTQSLSQMSTAQARPVVAKLAAAYSQQLPMITLWNYENVQFANTHDFTKFPSSAGLLDNAPGLWMWNGYVKSK